MDQVRCYTIGDGLRGSVRLITVSSPIHYDYDKYYDAIHQEEYSIQDKMFNPKSHTASANEETMY